MTKHIFVDPLTPLQGHLKIEAMVEGGVVKEVKSSGMLWRGFEQTLGNRDPLDAQRITQRTCGFCPAAHATASTETLESAFGIAHKIPANGRVIRNLVLGSDLPLSQILHFYQPTALDHVDVTAVADYGCYDPYLSRVQKFIQNGSQAPLMPP